MMLLSSCALNFSKDGCVLGSYQREDGSTYRAGPCVGVDTDNDGNADIDRFRVSWENEEGQELRGTYWINDERPPLVEYLVSPGFWIQWDSKSGVSLGAVPPQIEPAIPNNL